MKNQKKHPLLLALLTAVCATVAASHAYARDTVANFPIDKDMNLSLNYNNSASKRAGPGRAQSCTFTRVAWGRPNAPAVATVTPSFTPSALISTSPFSSMPALTVFRVA